MYSPITDRGKELLKIVLSAQKEFREIEKFDLLDNQNYNSLNVGMVMQQVDSSFQLQVKTRGGADYSFGGNKHGEMKACKADGNSHRNWAFHALAVTTNLREDNYLFYVHEAGAPTRIYDVRDKKKVEIINEHLLTTAQTWKTAVANGTKNGKNDIVSVKETFIKPLFEKNNLYEYTNTDGLYQTNRSDIMKNKSQDDAVSIYSDTLT